MEKLALKNALVFLVKTCFKPVLGDFWEIGFYEIDLHNIYIKLCRVCTEVKITLKEEIIELARLSATRSVRDADFSSSWISVRKGVLWAFSKLAMWLRMLASCLLVELLLY